MREKLGSWRARGGGAGAVLTVAPPASAGTTTTTTLVSSANPSTAGPGGDPRAFTRTAPGTPRPARSSLADSGPNDSPQARSRPRRRSRDSQVVDSPVVTTPSTADVEGDGPARQGSVGPDPDVSPRPPALKVLAPAAACVTLTPPTQPHPWLTRPLPNERARRFAPPRAPWATRPRLRCGGCASERRDPVDGLVITSALSRAQGWRAGQGTPQRGKHVFTAHRGQPKRLQGSATVELVATCGRPWPVEMSRSPGSPSWCGGREARSRSRPTDSQTCRALSAASEQQGDQD